MLRTCAKYRTIFDLIDEMIFLLDVKGNILEYNQYAAHVLGCDPGDLINKPVKELVAKEHWSTLYEVLNTKGAHKVHTVKFVTAIGINFDAAIQIYNVRTDDEDYSILFVRNIKNSKSDNSQLLMLLSSLECSLIPFEITNENKEILYVNKAFEKETKYLPNEVIGENFTKYLTAVNLELFLEKKKTLREFVELKRKDGTMMVSDMLLSPLYIKGKMKGYFILYTDLSRN
jgi:PAS domain S-box-containing protein